MMEAPKKQTKVNAVSRNPWFANFAELYFALPARNLKQDAAVDCDNLAINVFVLRQKDDTLRHLLVAARSARGHMSLVIDLLLRHLALLVLIALSRRHLRREIARRNAVHSHARLLELMAHELREMHGGALGGVVGKVTLSMRHDS